MTSSRVFQSRPLMKKNQMRTPGPRTCDIRASLLPLLYSSAMGEESRPSGPGVSSM
ncbi:MAG TPA: hypothetical protein VFS43_25945 [Polyangiaceae bacterium]|nr:hypothetical protein [Polyangiaceae bacterium]